MSCLKNGCFFLFDSCYTSLGTPNGKELFMLEETQEQEPRRKPRFDIARYKLDQIVEALTCPINRHATCVKHNCDDNYLHEHPELLINHYNDHGGAEAYARHRNEFVSLCEFIKDCRFSEDCDLALTKTDYKKCPLRRLGDHCRSLCKLIGITSNPTTS